MNNSSGNSETPYISQLWIYPIKSCSGISVSTMNFDSKGPLFDRRWMLVDGVTGKFLSQRNIPKMALIHTEIIDDEIVAKQSFNQSLDSEYALPKSGQLIDVKVWSDEVKGYDCGDEAAAWFSHLLDSDCRLVYQGDCNRVADEEFAEVGTEVSFSDGFPLLVIAQSSVDVLNNACRDTDISANNFRPNIVIENTAAFSEIEWATMSTKLFDMKVVKPCQRCVIPTINPKTAQREKSILTALLQHCARDKKIYFGQNLTFSNVFESSLRVGDVVSIRSDLKK